MKSRTAHFGIGLLLGFLCFCFGGMAFMVYVGSAVSPGSGYIVGVAFFGILCLGSAVGTFWSLTHALRSPRKDAGCLPPRSDRLQEAPHLSTPEERLAHLAKERDP